MIVAPRHARRRHRIRGFIRWVLPYLGFAAFFTILGLVSWAINNI